MPDRIEQPNQRPRIPLPFVSKLYVPAGEVRTIPPCNFVRVYSVAGSLTLTFLEGDPVPASAGDKYKADFGQMFKKVDCEATGGAAVVIYGNGDTSNQSVYGLATIVTTSPEGSLAGVPGNLAYNSTDGSLWIKLTGTGTNTGWVLVTA